MAFKTSDECRVELVANTTKAVADLTQHDDWWTTVIDDLDADFLPVSAARASFGKEDKTGENEQADIKLLKFLADNRHVSVFEHNYATFLIECPLFVRSQIIRHRSFTFNEMSRRYTSDDIGFWIPDKLRKQSSSNKQASTDEEVTVLATENGFAPYVAVLHPRAVWVTSTKEALSTYNLLLENGVCREQARAVLPQSLLTRFYMTGNLRSWWSFLNSRLKEDTQYETRVIAQRIKKELDALWPESMKALFNE